MTEPECDDCEYTCNRSCEDFSDLDDCPIQIYVYTEPN